jgi:hypothetical protein
MRVNIKFQLSFQFLIDIVQSFYNFIQASYIILFDVLKECAMSKPDLFCMLILNGLGGKVM